MAHILLAEDDHAMRSFLQKSLENAGHKVTSRHDGLEALEEIEDEAKNYELLLTDIIMPGMDGIELSKKASSKRPDLKVMFITGFSVMMRDPKYIEGQHDDGFNSNTPTTQNTMQKPFHLRDLVNKLQTILAS